MSYIGARHSSVHHVGLAKIQFQQLWILKFGRICCTENCGHYAIFPQARTHFHRRQLEKAQGVSARGTGNCFEGNPSNLRDLSGSMDYVSRLIVLPSKRLRREVRTIGLEKDSVFRQVFHNSPEHIIFLVSNCARYGDVKAEIQRA